MTNSIYWPGTTIVRSTCNAFDLSTAARVDTRAMQITENLRAGSAKGVETRNGKRGPSKGGTNINKLRTLMADGPKTLAQMSEAIGLPTANIQNLIAHDRLLGKIVMLEGRQPRQYALAKAPT